MNINIGLTENQRNESGEILSLALADQYILYTKTRNFHWNVKGLNFSELHAFFENQYSQLDDFIDKTAERIRQLGRVAPGSLQEFLTKTRLAEAQCGTDAHEMLAQLLKDHETIIRQYRSDVDVLTTLGDAGNADFLTGLLENHEKMAWMLRSYLS